jgi:hypothetical protein
MIGLLTLIVAASACGSALVQPTWTPIMITATPIVALSTDTPTPRPTRTLAPTSVLSAPGPTPTRTPFTIPTPDPSRGGPTIFPGLDPQDVFYVMVQYNDGADYYLYEYDERAGSVCDKSRPEGTRECNLDLAAFIAPFIAIPVEEYLSQMPTNIVWNFDWDKWEGNYTQVLVAMEIRTYDAGTRSSRRWWFGASPLTDEYTFAYIRNRYDHFNYAVIDAAKLNALVGLRAPLKR